MNSITGRNTMADITYVCKRTVVSTKPVRPNLCYLLSVLDRLMEPRHLQIVFYYHTTQKRDVGELTVKLRESLSETLTSFPIMMGRLQRDEEERWTIKCNDAGVRVVEARASGSVDEWLRDVDREKELRLVHWEEMSHKPYYWSTFYIQMTEFEEGGMAIGLSCIHLLADPFCATAFIDAWAKTTLAQEIHIPPAFVSLPKRHAQDHDHANNSLISYYKTSITKSIPLTNQQNHSTLTLTFSDMAVRLCIEMAKQTGGIDRDEKLSPFEAMAGLFWARLGRVKGIRQGPVRMSLGHDVRKILGLEKGFFGNCIVYNSAQLEINDDAGIGVGEAARAIKDTISQFDRLNVLGLIDWLHLHDHANSLTKGPNGFLGFSDLVCVNLDDVGPYHAGFEVGLNPKRASYYIEPACVMGQILILPSHEGVESRDVMVTATEDDLARLLKDDLVQQLGATILMDGNLSSSN